MTSAFCECVTCLFVCFRSLKEFLEDCIHAVSLGDISLERYTWRLHICETSGGLLSPQVMLAKFSQSTEGLWLLEALYDPPCRTALQ